MGAAKNEQRAAALQKKESKRTLQSRLMAFTKIPGTLVRNRALVRQFTSAALTLDRADRKERFETAWGILWHKILTQDIPNKLENAKGQAKRLLTEWPWLKQHLASLPHFGTLQEFVAPMNPTRLYYVALQLELALQLKSMHRGLGLGSPVPSVEYTALGKSTTGLELLQLWSLLLSAGHLFGTFATERALAYRLRREPALADAFLKGIEGPARAACEPLVRAGPMNALVGALAAWQVSTGITDTKLRNVCLSALFLYYSPLTNEQFRRFRLLHDRVRQAAYHRLQGTCSFALQRSHLQPEVAIVSMSATPGNVAEDPNLAFDPDIVGDTPNARLLAAIDAYQESELFTSPAANRLVLQHVREFKAWWIQQDADKIPLTDRINTLFSRPPDWPSIPSGSETHAVRIEFPAPSDVSRWVDEVQSWIGDRDGAHWRESNFLLTQTKTATVVDLFGPNEGVMCTSALAHVAERLAETTSNAGYSVVAARSFARFGQWAFGNVLRPGYTSFLIPARGRPELGLCLIERDLGRLSTAGARFIAETADERRKREVATSLSALRALSRPSDPVAWLMFTGTVQLFAPNGPDAAGEIDGLAAMFFRDRVRWVISESKVLGQPGATRQLDDLRGLICVSASAIETLKTDDSKVSSFWCDWNAEDR